eukprot:2386646-Lingulodinium_polyedra.AAC.1
MVYISLKNQFVAPLEAASDISGMFFSDHPRAATRQALQHAGGRRAPWGAGSYGVLRAAACRAPWRAVHSGAGAP